MKLDKIKFAELIGYCANRGMTVDKADVLALDDFIDIEQPEQERVYPMNNHIDELMKLMVEGQRKIEAIKTHRAITGFGLKESKDAVEKYWPNKPSKAEICGRIEKYFIFHDMFDEMSVATKANELAEIIMGE